MTLSALIRMLGDLAEVAVTILLAYLVYKVAVIVDALNSRLKRES